MIVAIVTAVTTAATGAGAGLVAHPEKSVQIYSIKKETSNGVSYKHSCL